MALVPLTDVHGIWHEVWLYLDDATHKYSTNSKDDAPARVISISPITHELGSAFGGASIGNVTVVLVNTTANGTAPSIDSLEFSKLFDNIDGPEWLNREMEVYQAVESTSGTVTKTLLFTGALDSAQVVMGRATVSARSETTARMGDVTPVQITAGIFPLAAPANIGQYLPIVLGTPSAIPLSGAPGPVPAFLIDSTAQVVCVAGHQTAAAPSYTLWYTDGDKWAVVDPTAMTEAPADTIFTGAGTLSTVTLITAGTYTFDATHVFASDVDGIISGGAVVTNPIEVLQDLGETYAGLATLDFDAATLLQAITDTATLTIAGVLTEPKPYLTVLAEITAAFDVDVYFTRAGLVAFNYFTASAVSFDTFTDYSHIYTALQQSFSTEAGDGRRSIANRIVSSFDWSPVLGIFLSNAQDDDLVAQASMKRVYLKTDENRYIGSSAVANEVNQHRLNYRNRPLQKASFELSVAVIPDKMPTDVIGVTHIAGLKAGGGGWVGMPCRIESITYFRDRLMAAVDVIRYDNWLEDAYFFGTEVPIIDGAATGNVTLSIGSPTVTGLSGAEAATLTQGNIFIVNTADNELSAFVNAINTTTGDFTLNAEPGGSGAAVNATANESTSEWEIVKNWDQGSDSDKFYGGLASGTVRTSAGTVAANSGESVIIGTATQFQTDSVAVGDEIVIRDENGYWGLVTQILSETQIVTNSVAPGAFAGAAFEIFPGDAKIEPSSTLGRKL